MKKILIGIAIILLAGCADFITPCVITGEQKITYYDSSIYWDYTMECNSSILRNETTEYTFRSKQRLYSIGDTLIK